MIDLVSNRKQLQGPGAQIGAPSKHSFDPLPLEICHIEVNGSSDWSIPCPLPYTACVSCSDMARLSFVAVLEDLLRKRSMHSTS